MTTAHRGRGHLRLVKPGEAANSRAEALAGIAALERRHGRGLQMLAAEDWDFMEAVVNGTPEEAHRLLAALAADLDDDGSGGEVYTRLAALAADLDDGPGGAA
jgi:hypothetical protein